MENEYIWKALRDGKYGGTDVMGFKEAKQSSVLAGQILTCFIDNYEDEASALAAYPEAKDGCMAPPVSVAHLPGEDDPVPGGMYPDDLDGDWEEGENR